MIVAAMNLNANSFLKTITINYYKIVKLSKL